MTVLNGVFDILLRRTLRFGTTWLEDYFVQVLDTQAWPGLEDFVIQWLIDLRQLRR